jgi:hypothetical protein
VRPHRRHQHRPVLGERLSAGEEAQVTARRRSLHDLTGGRGDGVRRREKLRRRRDVVARSGEQEQRTGDVREVGAAPVDDEAPVDELVLVEEVLDQPQVEGTRDVLVCLNQSSKTR